MTQIVRTPFFILLFTYLISASPDFTSITINLPVEIKCVSIEDFENEKLFNLEPAPSDSSVTFQAYEKGLDISFSDSSLKDSTQSLESFVQIKDLLNSSICKKNIIKEIDLIAKLLKEYKNEYLKIQKAINKKTSSKKVVEKVQELKKDSKTSILNVSFRKSIALFFMLIRSIEMINFFCVNNKNASSFKAMCECVVVVILSAAALHSILFEEKIYYKLENIHRIFGTLVFCFKIFEPFEDLL